MTRDHGFMHFYYCWKARIPFSISYLRLLLGDRSKEFYTSVVGNCAYGIFSKGIFALESGALDHSAILTCFSGGIFGRNDFLLEVTLLKSAIFTNKKEKVSLWALHSRKINIFFDQKGSILTKNDLFDPGLRSCISQLIWPKDRKTDPLWKAL